MQAALVPKHGAGGRPQANEVDALQTEVASLRADLALALSRLSAVENEVAMLRSASSANGHHHRALDLAAAPPEVEPAVGKAPAANAAAVAANEAAAAARATPG
eukprot:538626-Prymnesium_polylepis.1